MTPEQDQLEVVITGGGVAALEAMMALRAHAQHRVAITLVAPDERFSYRPLSVGEPFALGAAETLPLQDVASDLGATYRRDALASVEAGERSVTLASGEKLRYDVLVLATGARRVPAIPHATTFRGQEDSEALHGLIQDLEGEYVRRIVFVVPAGVTWSLPIYELALMTARRAYEMYVKDAAVTVVTPEERPLAVFGPAASAAVAKLLEDAGVRFVGSTTAEVPDGRHVALHPGGGTLECDRIVALAAVEGIEIPGVPTAADGFVPVDAHGRVSGLDDVYAAGDGTDFPVKQGGIACQQADAVAEAIAARVGALAHPQPFEPILRGELLTGARPQYMRTDLSGRSGDVSAVSEETLWWPPAKVAGMYLAPYLDARHAGLPTDEASGVVRERVLMMPAKGGHEFELLGFERNTRS